MVMVVRVAVFAWTCLYAVFAKADNIGQWDAADEDYDYAESLESTIKRSGRKSGIARVLQDVFSGEGEGEGDGDSNGTSNSSTPSPLTPSPSVDISTPSPTSSSPTPLPTNQPSSEPPASPPPTPATTEEPELVDAAQGISLALTALTA